MSVKEKIELLERAKAKLLRERAEIDRKIKLNEEAAEKLLDRANESIEKKEVSHS